MPNLFRNKIFHLLETNNDTTEVKQLIHSLGGKISKKLNQRVHYVICHPNSSPERYDEAAETGKPIISPEWIVSCHKLNKLLNLKNYIATRPTTKCVSAANDQAKENKIANGSIVTQAPASPSRSKKPFKDSTKSVNKVDLTVTASLPRNCGISPLRIRAEEAKDPINYMPNEPMPLELVDQMILADSDDEGYTYYDANLESVDTNAFLSSHTMSRLSSVDLMIDTTNIFEQISQPTQNIVESNKTCSQRENDIVCLSAERSTLSAPLITANDLAEINTTGNMSDRNDVEKTQLLDDVSLPVPPHESHNAPTQHSPPHRPDEGDSATQTPPQVSPQSSLLSESTPTPTKRSLRNKAPSSNATDIKDNENEKQQETTPKATRSKSRDTSSVNTPSPPSAKSSKKRKLADSETTEPSPKRQKTNQKSINVALSGFPPAERDRITKVLSSIGVNVMEEVDDNIQLVVTNSPPARTKKVLHALARQIPIVTPAWVQKSVKSKAPVDLDGFEEISFPCKKSVANPKLFDGKKVLVDQKAQFMLGRNDIEYLLQRCGAKLVKHYNDADIVITAGRRPFVAPPGETKNVPIVGEKWLLDSLTTWKVQDPNKFPPQTQVRAK